MLSRALFFPPEHADPPDMTILDKLKAKKLELEILSLEQGLEEYASGDYHSRVYPLSGYIDEASGRQFREVITEWHRRDPEGPIEILFNSPGGDIFEGLAMYDLLKWVRHTAPVTCSIIGIAASMAAVVFQAGEVREMSENSFLMIHDGFLTPSEERLSLLKDEVALMDRIEKKGWEILAQRAKMSEDDLRVRCHRRDWWLDATESVDVGFADLVF